MTSERAVAFGCAGDSLVGIVHAPHAPCELGVVVVVGGPQYRAGSHRQFVLLARAVAAAGFAVLRFDARGMGDSSGARRGFEDLDDDIGAAIGALLDEVPALRRVALWGLCDGASAALLDLDASRDPRVVAVCAVNPWVRSAEGLARTQVRHYYTRRLLTRSFWAKLLRGGIGWSAVLELAPKLALAARSAGRAAGDGGEGFAERMARACAQLAPGALLVVLSESDYTAKEFADYAARSPRWQRTLHPNKTRRCDLAGADHTFSQPEAQRAAEAATVQWLKALCPPSAQPQLRASEAGGP